jgi:hypothetical protein
MDDPFETAEEREAYQLQALHAVSLTGPATFMEISVQVGESAPEMTPVDDEKLRAAVKRLQYRDLVFIDRDNTVHIAEP